MRQNVNYDDIANAAESIIAQGSTPTIERIRIFLGSRGSNSTISKYLNHWRKNNSVNGKQKSPLDFKGKDNLSNELNPNAAIKRQLDLINQKYNVAIKEKEQFLNKLKEKNNYIKDLKQANKLSLEVLRENYQKDLVSMEEQINLLSSKMERYFNKYNKEKELYLIKLKKILTLLAKTKNKNRTIKKKLLILTKDNIKLKNLVDRTSEVAII